VEEQHDCLDAAALECGASLLPVSASSRNSRPATPAGVAMTGVPSSVSPMKATLSPVFVFTILYGGNSGLSVLVSMTFAARNWKTEPARGVPSWQPSTGWHPSVRGTGPLGRSSPSSSSSWRW
jgi:hypothetical protein